VSRALRIAVLCPHFAPDTAPTGVVITRIVDELVALGHHVQVVTSLPWYRSHAIEPEWRGRWRRAEATDWGRIVRLHPFPGDDKRNLVRRALGFAGFTVLSTVEICRGGKVDAVVAMSPPLTLGLAGWIGAKVRRGALVFNIQDVFPDAAVTSGAITNRHVIRAASWLERLSYRRADAVTVLSDDLRANLAAKVPRHAACIRVIPNFVDTAAIRPMPRLTSWRKEHGLGDGPVVMYAGNVGFSQSLELVLAAAKEMPSVTFVINGDGAARASLQAAADDLPNVRFTGYQPAERLAEVLASADVHVVLLRRGLGNVSVPSKTYSILAAGRPVLAAIDADTEVPRILEASGGGLAVPPDDAHAFTAALQEMVADLGAAAAMGRRGRSWVERAASPAAVGGAYASLISELA
jgi:colanic acid biosynthesis glycosyl transferase WcaI